MFYGYVVLYVKVDCIKEVALFKCLFISRLHLLFLSKYFHFHVKFIST